MGSGMSVPYGVRHRRLPRNLPALKGRLQRPNYKKVLKKVKTSTKRVTRSRTVVRSKRAKKMDYTRNPLGSTFVKCVDKKLPDVKRYLTPFARKVMMATLPQYALREFTSEFSFFCKAGPLLNNSNSTTTQIVGWNQLAFNTLNPLGVFNASNISGVNRLVASSYHCDQVVDAEPWGLYRQGTVWSGLPNSNIDFVPPTLSNIFGTIYPDSSIINPAANAKTWQGDSYIQLELRNPQQFGVRATIYEIGARAKHENARDSSTGAGLGSITYNLPAIGSPTFSNTSLQVDYQKSPLETFIMGMARKGINQKSVGAARQIGLNDSPDFVDAFRTYKLCHVYIPPGGTLYKTYKLKSRILDTSHILRNAYDRSTKFIVIKTMPEVQALPKNTAAGPFGSVIGPDTQPGEYGKLGPYESQVADAHLICTATYRMSARVLPTNIRTDTFYQSGYLPSGAGYLPGSGKPYVYQANDQGTRSIQGTNNP